MRSRVPLTSSENCVLCLGRGGDGLFVRGHHSEKQLFLTANKLKERKGKISSITAFVLHTIHWKHLQMALYFVEIFEISILLSEKNIIETQLQINSYWHHNHNIWQFCTWTSVSPALWSTLRNERPCGFRRFGQCLPAPQQPECVLSEYTRFYVWENHHSAKEVAADRTVWGEACEGAGKAQIHK